VLHLKEARATRGLSRPELASRAGVSVSTIARIERGTTLPRPHVARRLAAALGVPADAIAELRAALAGAWLRPPALVAR